MTETWLLGALWLGLALVATLLSIWLRVATALSEIVVGTVAQLIIGATLGTALLHTDDFSPFTWKTGVFFGGASVACAVLPFITPHFFKRYGNRPSELETKFLLLTLFGLGGLATWSGSEAVLPAYLVGMVLAGDKDHALIRRLRTLTFGLLTPFYFIRAGSLVSLPSLVAAPLGFVALLFGKMVSKCIGVYPATQVFRAPRQEAIYTTLLMSTGLTFGTISALFGLSHGVITRPQYSAVVAAVVASAVVPTLIANAFFLPRHLLKQSTEVGAASQIVSAEVTTGRVS
jgi:glutathione-regulated potassium-efflux system ancillary protein KefC